LRGLKDPLQWTQDKDRGLIIRIPAALEEHARRNLSLAYAFKLEEQP
jgi:hypothetical protein